MIKRDRKRSVELSPAILAVYNAGERVGPPARKYVEVTSEAVFHSAWKKNLLWVLVRLHASANQNISGWTGFNISTRDDVTVTQDNIGYLPTIDAPASNLSTVYEVLLQSDKIRKTLRLNSIVVVFDQALYAKATEIIWKRREQFQDLIPRMGVFHTICTMLAIIGKRFQDAGLRDLCIEARVIAEGSVSGVLEGRHYNRAVRVHKLVYEALLRLAWKGFLSWLQIFHEDKEHLVGDIWNDLEALEDNVCQHKFEEIKDSPTFLSIMKLFDIYLNYLRQDNGQLSTFWMTYIDMVEIILGLLRASREGNWPLHLSSIRAMIPWCFAYDRLNYARYLSAYLSQMSHLEEEHPEVHNHLMSGGFSVQVGEDNPFGRIPIDQACEETINKDTQTPGGTKGFSLKPGAVSRYYMVAEYRSIFLGQLREMLHLKSYFNHADLQKRRTERDEADVKSLVEMLENNWNNPFDNEKQELICISTGRVASPEVEEDSLCAKQRGEQAFLEFSRQRIESSPPKKNFHDKLSKLNLKTFSELNKKKTIRKESGKEIILKADRMLFGQIIVIAESRSLSMSDVLAHPLGPLPWSLATADGSLRKTNKSSLAKDLQRNVTPAESIPQPSATIVDGMNLVQRIKGDHKTFAELADNILSMAIKEGFQSKRIDVVFDVYRPTSIKKAERQHRTNLQGTQFKNITCGHKIQQWRKFLAEESNKKALAAFLSSEWQQDKHRDKLQDKILYVTCEEQCHKITSEYVKEVHELKSSQEEADTRLLLHAAHAGRDGYEAAVIVSEDTDVFVLCLAFQTRITCPLYQKCGTQTRTKYVDIAKVVQAHGEEFCKALPGVHAFTGCDYVSAFAGHGKVSALQLVRRDKAFQETFQQLGESCPLSEELFLKLQKFACQLYSSTSRTESVNALRYMLFCAKKGELESNQLPPCADCLRKHSQRANYQARVWRESLAQFPEVPTPVGSCWCLDVEDTGGENLTVDWMDGLLLDLSAAFDTVDHDILLFRLQQRFGVTGKPLLWFKSYLSNRMQFVSVDGAAFSDHALQCGVPQGSVLGPILYVLYTSPLSDIVKKFNLSYHFYADDSQLYLSFQPTIPSDRDLAVSNIERCVHEIDHWMLINRLKLNKDKTELLVISAKHLPRPTLQEISVVNETICSSQKARNIGVIFDHHFRFNEHIASICKSSFYHLRNISNIRKYLSSTTTEILVHAFVSSKLDNCNSLLYGLPNCLLKKLQHVQNAAARLITLSSKHEHITPILFNLHWLPVNYRIIFKILLISYKALNDLAPSYVRDLLTPYTPSRQLRSSSKDLLSIPHFNLKTYGARSFSVAAPTLWNSLPSDIKNSSSVSLFKHKLKTFLFQKAFL